MSGYTDSTTQHPHFQHYPKQVYLGDRDRRLVRIAKRDGWFCHYCGVPIVPADSEPCEPYYYLLMRKSDWQNFTWQQKELADKGLYIKWDIFWTPVEPFEYGQVEHKTPKALGGTGHIDNLAIACAACNAEKSAMPYEEYMAICQERKTNG